MNKIALWILSVQMIGERSLLVMKLFFSFSQYSMDFSLQQDLRVLPRLSMTIAFLLLPSKKALSIRGGFPQSVQNNSLQWRNDQIFGSFTSV